MSLVTLAVILGTAIGITFVRRNDIQLPGLQHLTGGSYETAIRDGMIECRTHFDGIYGGYPRDWPVFEKPSWFEFHFKRQGNLVRVVFPAWPIPLAFAGIGIALWKRGNARVEIDPEASTRPWRSCVAAWDARLVLAAGLVSTSPQS